MSQKMFKFIFCAVIWLFNFSSSCLSCHFSHKHGDEITDLPGLDFDISFKQYSGYLDVSSATRYFYWFVEAETDPDTAPILLWLNGGPGCSSLDGLLSEHGPFLINSDGVSVRRNSFSWNKLANVIYLESPAGVGFSYTLEVDPKLNDYNTAENNYKALKDFYRKFPQYSDNDLYLSGESYGGVYVPTLADRIYKDKKINLKGLAVGNGFNGEIFFHKAYYCYLHHRGLISEQQWAELLEVCVSADNTNGVPCQGNWTINRNEACNEFTNRIHKNNLEFINPYNTEKECYLKEKSTENKYLFRAARSTDYLPPMKNDYLHIYRCLNNTAVTNYLNLPQVQRALHVDENHVKQPWEICSTETKIRYIWQHDTTKDIYTRILPEGKVRAMIYYGVLDTLCSYLAGEWFSDSLGFKIVEPWRPWQYTGSYNQTQTGGHVQVYEHNMNFVTIKGAGHSTPIDKPMQSFELLKRFLSGESI